MKKISKKKIIIFVVAILVLGSVFGYCGYRVLRKTYHVYKTFTSRCDYLQQQIYMLSNKLERYTNYYRYDDVKYNDDAYNYLAIGNSLTLIDDENRGICASHEDTDYYSLVVKELKNRHNKVFAYRHNFAIWELSGKPHECLHFFDYVLSDKLNLITIQLSENFEKLDTLETDFKELILYIKEKAPNADIIVLGDFWSKEKSNIKEKVCKDLNIKYASLDEAFTNNKYKAKIGDICYHPDGSSHKIDVAAGHPNDDGFKYIYKKIMTALGE